MPILYLFNADYIYAYRRRLHGFAPNAFLPTWNAYRWRVRRAASERSRPGESALSLAESGGVIEFFLQAAALCGVMSFVVLLAGLITIPTLPISQYPQISPPTVTVTSQYPGRRLPRW